MRQILTYWKMAFVRALVYMAIVGGGTFLTQTETWSDATWRDMGPFLKSRFLIGVSLSALGVLLAFLDKTVERLSSAVRPEIPETPVKPLAQPEVKP